MSGVCAVGAAAPLALPQGPSQRPQPKVVPALGRPAGPKGQGYPRQPWKLGDDNLIMVVVPNRWGPGTLRVECWRPPLQSMRDPGGLSQHWAPAVVKLVHVMATAPPEPLALAQRWMLSTSVAVPASVDQVTQATVGCRRGRSDSAPA